MNLSQYSDSKLLSETERLVFCERENLTLLLHHLAEIQRRRLFSTKHFRSLHDYLERGLCYPPDQAYRRVAAMRLMEELPAIEPKIQSGALNLTVLGMAASIFKREGLKESEKLAVISQLEGIPTREAGRILAKLYPISGRDDKIQNINGDSVELRITASHSILEKIETLRGLIAHTHPEISLGALFELLCAEGIENRTKFAAPRKKVRVSAPNRTPCCELCGSTYALEIDHITPKALGGSDAPENLRLLCRNCNQRAAIEALGQATMDPFIN